ncbi:porin [Paraburkholderia caffeinilytica]|uniref:porin n=1 Tax=Paraburkholderia caffeinilytica TaxID=1761016 RepID=UPI0038BDE4DA
MKVLRIALACALCIYVPFAAADSVTLYGNLDTGLEYVSHVGANGNNLFRMPGVTASLPSFWGFKGVENLGAGYSAEFTLESGFDVRSGVLGQGGRLFGRQAWVGLNTPYGRFAFGRQYTALYYALFSNDVIGPSIYSAGSLDAYLASARSDNTVSYLWSASDFTVAGTYSFGRDSTGTGNTPGQGTCVGENAASFTQCTQWSAIAKYTGPSFGVIVAYDEQHGGPGAYANFFDGIAPEPLSVGADVDRHLLASGYVNVAKLIFSAGWISRTVDFSKMVPSTVRTDLWFAGTSWTVAPDIIWATQVYRIVNAEHDTRATLVTTRATYQLSKASAVYVQVGYLANSAHAAYSVSTGGGGTTPLPGTNQTGAMLGIRHFF